MKDRSDDLSRHEQMPYRGAVSHSPSEAFQFNVVTARNRLEIPKVITISMYIVQYNHNNRGARCSSTVDHLLVEQRIIRSILHGGTIKLFLIPVSTPQLVQQSHGMYYHVYDMVHIKEPLLLFKNNSLCSGGSRFHLSISE